MRNKQDFLRSAELFRHLNENQLEKLAYKADVESHAKNHIIFLSGDTAKYIYLVIDGWVKGFRTSFNGEESILAIAGANTTFGDVASLGKSNYSISAQAVTPVKLLKIPYLEFIEVIKNDPKSLDVMFKMHAERQLYLVEEVERLTTCTANERIGLFLLNMLKNDSITSYEDENVATIKLPYAKSLVASQLGMQAETFSRAFSKLKKQDLINSSQRNITVSNISKLKDFCRVPQMEI